MVRALRDADVVDELMAVHGALDTAARAIAVRLSETRLAQERLTELEAQAATAAATRDQTREETARLTAECEAARQEAERWRAEAGAERNRAEEAARETARVAEHFEDALDELRGQHAATVRAQAVECAALPLDSLLTAFNAFARARTPGAVVATLRSGLLREFSRVGVFRLAGDRLEGETPTGGDTADGVAPVVVPLTADSLLSRAVASRRIQSSVGDELMGLPGVQPAGGSACAVALPIAVHGETLVVIYADISDPPEYAPVTPHLLVKFAELLLRHATLVALRIAVEQRAASGSREPSS